MAIKPTPNNNLYKGLVFDGVDSRDYGIYITGDAVFNSPERDVEMIEIPGRNGAYALDNGRFSNIKVSYPAGIAGDTEADFREGISAFRNALASRKGYKRLEDDYNPDEYRMAVYKSGLEVTPKALKAGEFTITFDCKPQRFLKSGETAVTIGGAVTNTQTKSGAVVALESDGGDAVTSLVAQIEPVQAGSGDPSPTNVRAITGQTSSNFYVGGKNILRINRGTTTVSGVTFTINSDGSVHVEGTTTADNVFVNLNYLGATKMAIPAGTWKAKVGSGASGNVRLQLISDNVFRGQGGTSDFNSITIPEGSYNSWCRLQIQNSGTTVNETLYPMICANTETSGTFKGYDGKRVSVSFGSAGTVYGGTLDVVTGVLTVNRLHAKWGEGVLANTTPSNITTLGNLTRFWLYVHSVKVFEALSVKCDRLKSIGSSGSGEYGDSTTTGIGSGAASLAPSCWIKLPTADVGTTASSIKAWLDANPIEITYPITPTTYQLTAQQVELLTGDNNVWADTGDITITWGDDPNKLVNPTLFESHPLIRVEGHGELSIGDADITVYSTELGRIDLPVKTARQSFTYSQYFTDVYDTEVFTTDFLNTGDKFYWNGGQYYVPFGTTNNKLVSSSSGGFNGLITTPGTYVELSATSRIDAMDWSTTRYYVGAKVLTPVEFTFGTAKTVTDSAVIDVTYTTDHGNTYTRTVTVAMSLTYTGLNNIGLSIRATNSADRAARYNTADHYFGTAPTFYGISTQTPGDLYIDADIGEAYFVAGDATLDANNYVYFMGDLPTLAPGVTEVTYSGITAVEITPRWWEV